MQRDLTFCQCFLRSETRKLMDKWMLKTNSSSLIATLPTATFKHRTFFIWNLMVDLRSITFASMLSLWVRRAGNLPALFSPGPKRRGICLIKDSEARKASYFLASFLTSFLFLLSFLRSSALMQGMFLLLASSMCCWSPRTHTVNLGRGTCFNLTVPEKRLSFWGS